MTRKRILTAAVAVAASIGVLGACTPEEVQQWQAWRAQDQAAADGYVQGLATEPEPAAAPSTEPSVWDKVAYCESGGNWAINLGSGYYGGLQMLGSTWRAYGGGEFASRADQATRGQQITVAERIRADVGYGAWPACTRRLGLR